MKFNEIIDDVKDSINDTKSKVVKAVDDAELDKRAKEFGNVAGDKLKSIDISILNFDITLLIVSYTLLSFMKSIYLYVSRVS